MKLLLDENVDYRLKPLLLSQGYDVAAIGADYTSGLPDKDVLRIARDEKRILITNDKDFGDLIFRQRLPHHGVILLRLRDETLELVHPRLQQVLTSYPPHHHNFFVITANSVRTRKISPRAQAA